jgi:Zn-dependent M28 family amino/carboxypeptidase
MIPGEGYPDEYVVIGAHYDHLGTGDCRSSDPSDRICNGATDNATGVAVALAAAEAIAAGTDARRSVLITLWDAEEDDLLGSTHYVTTAPILPLDQTVAYINFDGQGIDLVPAARHMTFAVGAETGGPSLTEAVRRATTTSTLDTRLFSVPFGQGRSDHRTFVNAGVPSVFFTDATSACYHTAQDDVTAVDFAKLDQEIATAAALAADLVTTGERPVLDHSAPVASYSDAVSLLALATAVEPDFDLLGVGAASAGGQVLRDVRAIVDAGASAFDADDTSALLGGAGRLVEALTIGDCDALDP